MQADFLNAIKTSQTRLQQLDNVSGQIFDAFKYIFHKTSLSNNPEDGYLNATCITDERGKLTIQADAYAAPSDNASQCELNTYSAKINTQLQLFF